MNRRAFSLIELAMALTLASIVVVGAIVVGLGVTRSVQHTSAEMLLDTVTAAELALAGNQGAYSADAARLGVLDGVTVTTGASSRPGEVSLAVGSGGTLAMATVDSSGTCVVRVLGDILAGAARTDTTSSDGCLASRHLPLDERPQS